MELSIETGNFRVPESLIAQLVQFGLSKSEILEVIMCHGRSPLDLAKLLSKPTSKPASIRREASRLRNRLRSYSFVSYSKRTFILQIKDESNETILSFIKNNNRQQTGSHNLVEINNLKKEKRERQEQETNHHTAKKGDKKVPRHIEITDEIVSDADFMVTWFAESHVCPTLQTAITAIVSEWPKDRPYDSEAVRRAIRSIYPTQPTANAAGLFRIVLRSQLPTSFFVKPGKRDSQKEATSLDITAKFRREYIKQVQSQCTAPNREVGKEILACTITLHRERNKSYVTIEHECENEGQFHYMWELGRARKPAIEEALRTLNLPSLYEIKKASPKTAEAVGSY